MTFKDVTNVNRAGRVEGKLALVTGAGSGIGAASALALAREGAAVAVADIDLASAQRQVAAIEAEGGRAIALPNSVLRTPNYAIRHSHLRAAGGDEP